MILSNFGVQSLFETVQVAIFIFLTQISRSVIYAVLAITHILYFWAGEWTLPIIYPASQVSHTMEILYQTICYGKKRNVKKTFPHTWNHWTLRIPWNKPPRGFHFRKSTRLDTMPTGYRIQLNMQHKINHLKPSDSNQLHIHRTSINNPKMEDQALRCSGPKYLITNSVSSMYR